jgi:pimeloyl-ACP methyl ester carboxylesterase
LSGTVGWGGEGFSEKDYQGKSYQHLVINSEKRKLVENRILYPEGDYLNPKGVPIQKEYEIFWGGPNLQPKESLVTAPISDSLKKIQVPVLIFNGDREPCTTEVDWGKQYAQILPNAELYTIWGACHDPWLANPSEFFEKSR